MIKSVMFPLWSAVSSGTSTFPPCLFTGVNQHRDVRRSKSCRCRLHDGRRQSSRINSYARRASPYLRKLAFSAVLGTDNGIFLRTVCTHLQCILPLLFFAAGERVAKYMYHHSFNLCRMMLPPYHQSAAIVFKAFFHISSTTLSLVALFLNRFSPLWNSRKTTKLCFSESDSM